MYHGWLGQAQPGISAQCAPVPVHLIPLLAPSVLCFQAAPAATAEVSRKFSCRICCSVLSVRLLTLPHWPAQFVFHQSKHAVWTCPERLWAPTAALARVIMVAALDEVLRLLQAAAGGNGGWRQAVMVPLSQRPPQRPVPAQTAMFGGYIPSASHLSSAGLPARMSKANSSAAPCWRPAEHHAVPMAPRCHPGFTRRWLHTGVPIIVGA